MDVTPEPVDEYSAGPFVAEVYDPSVNNDSISVYGASFSDNSSGVIFGKCAVGATVTVKLSNGEYTVQSEGGRFAVRIKPDGLNINAVLTQSYNGTQIGSSLSWSGKVKVQGRGEEGFDAVIGYGNQGFFEKMLPDFTHTNLLDEKTANTVAKRVADRIKKINAFSKGCEMIFLIAPSVITTYPELVPEEIAVQGEGQSRLDQMIEILEGAGAKVIDVRDTFEKHKNDALPLYYNFDSHWSEYGAYLAYVELFNYISEKYPAAAPRKFSEFNWTFNYSKLGDMLYYFCIDNGDNVAEYAVRRTRNFKTSSVIEAIQTYKRSDAMAFRAYSYEVVNGKTYNTDREELPNLYVFRNSYGTQMFDLIPERGNTTVMNACFGYSFNLASITKINPNYVIYIVSEWDIHELINN